MKINWTGNDWVRVKNHCRTTVNKAFTDKEPTDDFKKKILISEHSPIRCLEIDWTWEDIPYWLSTEWSRHKFEKFITSQRDDRKIEEIPRGKKPQESPVNFDGYANAQNTIDAWRKRLCYKATPEARNLAEIFKYELHKIEPEWADVLQRNCIYRGGCPEFSSCGYWEKFCEKHKGENLLDIETRYRLFNEDFYKSQNTKYTKSIPLLKDGYYQISDAEQLYWFAQQINNNGETSISAVLTADIIVNENVLNADGTLNTSSVLTEWTPIGNKSNQYTGTFDGQNHTISGLYFNDENVDCVGLFGYNSCGTIKNVGVIDSYFNGKDCVGGICGFNSVTIENCYSTSTISGKGGIGGVCGANCGHSTDGVIGKIESSYNTGVVNGKTFVGGVCGNSDGTITNSYNTGVVNGKGGIGGVCGWNFGENGKIEACYSTGRTAGKNSVGGVCGYNSDSGTIENSYNTGSVSGLSDSNHRIGGVCGKNSESIVKNCYNIGTVSGIENVGGVCGDYAGTVENCRYLENCNAEGTTFDCDEGLAQSSDQFASGKLEIKVEFKGCEGGNYMLAKTTDEDGEEIKLYSMVAFEEFEDDFAENEDADMDAFDDFSYPLLKEDIIKQAKENGVDVSRLKFYWN